MSAGVDRRRFIINAAALPALLLPGAAPARLADETDAAFNARMAWWREARFGMFIHWGVSSVTGGRWQGKPVPGPSEYILDVKKVPLPEYEQLATRFNPVKFDATAIAGLARDAGMRYLIPTAKHHDGFCMFDSALTNWSVRRTPSRRDFIRELADATRAAGLRFGLYYSIMDWHHPDQKGNFPRYVEFMKGQVRELLTNYGEIAALFFDGEGIKGWSVEAGEDLERFIRSIQPNVVINNRVGRRSPLATRTGVIGSSNSGDYDTPEKTIPRKLPPRDWETNMTINDAWGWKIDEHNWKSPAEIVRMLSECVSLNGNFLLNIGPTDEGAVPAETVDRLAVVGRWMRRNGEAIYGTTAGPVNTWQVRSTRKANTIYLHLDKWPGTIVLKLDEKVKKVRVVSEPGRELPFKQPGGFLTLNLDGKRPEETVSVLAIEF